MVLLPPPLPNKPEYPLRASSSPTWRQELPCPGDGQGQAMSTGTRCPWPAVSPGRRCGEAKPPGSQPATRGEGRPLGAWGRQKGTEKSRGDGRGSNSPSRELQLPPANARLSAPAETRVAANPQPARRDRRPSPCSPGRPPAPGAAAVPRLTAPSPGSLPASAGRRRRRRRLGVLGRRCSPGRAGPGAGGPHPPRLPQATNERQIQER